MPHPEDPGPTRSTLLARLAESSANDDAWREFHAEYAGLIHRVARRRGLQPSDCDDVVQDVLVSLTRALKKFEYDRARGRFRTYLKRAVTHAVFDRFRQKGRKSAVSLLDPSDLAEMVDAETDDIWEQEWRSHHVERAMRVIDVEFSEKDRQAFRLYAQEDRGAAETAEMLDISVERVYQAKSRLMRRLGEIVADQIAEENAEETGGGPS